MVILECLDGMEYQTCGRRITCDDLRGFRNCSNSTCESGCFCRNGTVLKDGECIDPIMCIGIVEFSL